jgi:hypothetical protein
MVQRLSFKMGKERKRKGFSDLFWGKLFYLPFTFCFNVPVDRACRESVFVTVFSAFTYYSLLIFSIEYWHMVPYRGIQFQVCCPSTSCLPTLLHFQHQWWMVGNFRNSFLSNYWLQPLDSWYTALTCKPILRYLTSGLSLIHFLFTDFVKFTTLMVNGRKYS